MNHQQLVFHCCAALDGFEYSSMALDQYITRYFTNYRIENEEEQQFITEVFAGCVRYAGVLKVLTDGFFARLGKTVLLSETSLYTVITYLALFRIEELGVEQFTCFVKSLDTQKMYRFLSFALDEKNLLTWLKDNWQKHYDPAFVKSTLLDPVTKHLGELKKVLESFNQKIQVAGQQKKQKSLVRPPTDQKPFNLTQPKPKSVPMPEPIPKLKKHRPVPETTYKKPTELEELNKVKEINRQRAEERLVEATKSQFYCASLQKPEKVLKRIKEIEEEKEGKLKFDNHKANPIPSHLNADIPIKLNTAAILREGKLYQKKEEETLKYLERLEAGSKDATDFLEWQNAMRQKDLDERLANIERRKIEGHISHEEAILARQNLIKYNRQKVEKMKEETKEMFQEYLQAKFQQEQDMRLLVEKVMSGHANAIEAKKRLTEYKSKIVQEVREESRELMRQALEEAEQEMRQKMEIINQIRAMEAVPVIRYKFVDFTSTAGYGLLSEMSICELRERLALLREAEQRAEDERRDEILASKQAKDQLLMDTLETISKHRTEQSRAAAIRLEERKINHNVRKPIQNSELTKLQRQLEGKRAERLRAQEQSRIKISSQSKQRTSTLISEKKFRDEKRWQELERSRERISKLSSRGLENAQSDGMSGRIVLASTS